MSVKKLHILKSIGKVLLTILTVVVMGSLLFSLLAKVIPPSVSHLMAYCGLLFPYIVIANLILMVLWLFLDYRWSIAIALLIILNVNNIDRHFQLRDMEKPETLEKIQESAKKHFLANGFQRASLRKIVSDAGFTLGAFYGYYKSKEELFHALVEETATGILTSLTEMATSLYALPDEEKLAKMTDVFSADMPRLVDFLLENRDDVFHNDYLVKIFFPLHHFVDKLKIQLCQYCFLNYN